MAVNSFNNFTDLDAVNGVFQQEPRVFAHDASPIVVGAVNNLAPGRGLDMVNAGSTYTVGDTISLIGGGSGIVVTVRSITGAAGSGKILDYEVTTPGSGYSINDSLTDPGAGAAQFRVTNIDIPGTARRGACVYIGNGGGNITVIMESGNEVTFANVVSGQFLPILIKRMVSVSGTVANVLALY